MAKQHPSRDEFVGFAREGEPQLRRALVAACGTERGLDATEDALVYAWENWDKVQTARNPAGYLYRVAQRRAMRHRKTLPLLRETAVVDPPVTEPGLQPALEHLSKSQRIAVVLIDGYAWTNHEVADLLGVGRSTVQKHHERGLAKLRRELGVTINA